MNTRNICNFVGRLTADPTFVKNKEGKEFQARFTIAVKRAYKNKEGEYPTDFIQVRYSGETRLSVVKKIKKGQSLSIGGDMRSETYEKNGEKFYHCFLEAEALSWTPITNLENVEKLGNNEKENKDNFSIKLPW